MEQKRIESRLDVENYISKLRYALDHDAKIIFQVDRHVDDKRKIQNTNRYTIASLFPDENPEKALKRELYSLSISEYQHTVKDDRFPNRSEMRVFGRTYKGNGDVYIKIRVELMDLSRFGGHTTFVMSFHFAEIPFKKDDFPYCS